MACGGTGVFNYLRDKPDGLVGLTVPKSHATFFCSFFLYSCALYYQLLGTKTVWSASYGKQKSPSCFVLSTLALGKKKSTQVLIV